MPEVVWPGKYDSQGRRVFVAPRPLKLIDRERVGEDADPNRLIHGLSEEVLPALLPQWAGKIRLIIIDPPFASEASYYWSKAKQENPGSAFRDRWVNGLDSYLPWLDTTLRLLHALLAEDGTLYLHLDDHASHYVKALLDEVFGLENFRNEIIWHYNSGPRRKNDFGRRHDTILRYGKSKDCLFSADAVREPYSPDIHIPASKAHYYHPAGKVMGDVWNIPVLAQNDRRERTGYPTQKPLALLERMIQASSVEGDWVLDCFCGSGTTLVAAEKSGRRWIAADCGAAAVETTKERLRALPPTQPFVVQQACA